MKNIFFIQLSSLFLVFFQLELCCVKAFANSAPQKFEIENSASDCESISNINKFIGCALNHHIHLLDLRSSEQVSALKEGAAAQRPNPKIDTQAGVGQNIGDLLTQFQIKLAIPIEVGGKKGSRIALAEAERREAKVATDFGTLETLIDIYSRILKIHELHIHEKSFKESIQFIEKIYKLYQSRPHLDPEQLASKHLFEMIKQKYSFDLILLAQEMDSELNDLILMTQNKVPKESLKNMIFQLPEPQWPDLRKEIQGHSLWIQKMDAEVNVKEKNYDFQVSQSFPDFEIGPTYSQEYQGPLLTQFFGVSLSFPLPIFNINSGGRALAKAEMESAMTRKKLMETKENFEIKFLQENYQAMIGELKKLAPLLKNLDKSSPTKALFDKGLIPATLAIEIQRSHQELIMTAHELEVKTIGVLFKIRSIEGNIDAEKLTLWPSENKMSQHP